MEGTSNGEILNDSAPPINQNNKFPKGVFLIILNEFSDRFSTAGMGAILVLYLKQKLLYTDDEATEVFHIFTTMMFFLPIFGAILADGFLGKFKTILYMMIVYITGNLLVTLTSIPPLAIPAREFTILGLLLISLGSGGIKPCVAAFGGDQFKIPGQERHLTVYFSLFYFMHCAGSMISKLLSPILRSEVYCFEDKDCFSIAFGVPGVLIVTSMVLFACGKNLYIIKRPKRNIIWDVIKCIYTATKNRLFSKSTTKKAHWLDYGRDIYDDELISDIKETLGVIVVLLPLLVYWSLSDQLGSRWTLQASRMDGKFFNITFKPDQMQVMVPCIILLSIPLFQKFIYPFLGKRKLMDKNYQKMVAGCLIASVSFMCSGILEWHLEKTYPILPSQGTGQLRIFNGFNCNLEYSNVITGENFKIKPLEFYENELLNVEGNRTLIYNKTIGCSNSTKSVIEDLYIEENKAISYFYNNYDDNEMYRYADNTAKSRSGLPYLRILTNAPPNVMKNISLYNVQRENFEIVTNSTKTDLYELFADKYLLYLNHELIPIDIILDIGGVYALIINGIEDNKIEANLLIVTEPNSVSMLWTIPQLVTLAISDVLFSVSGYEYAFKEAPDGMKSFLQAYLLFTEALGNIVIVLITRLGSSYRQTMQFFFFAIINVVSTLIFYILLKRRERIKTSMENNSRRSVSN